ncbi:hypothetical protein ACN42_g11545 [Penicillium freii]|uniref:Peptidase S12 Pab87-related C-terminal domain-containing protein n=1 Tax=Penicillium freii TaxID=48697 RepID=A0A101M7Y9_PENFR|nr:hypothetical protein ACN42_g11545 [Penicillium freii]
MVGFLPSKGFGFAMMGNTTNFRNAQVEIYMHLLDRIFGGSGTPCSGGQATEAENRKIGAKSGCMEEAIKRLYPSLPDPVISHSLPLDQYAGKYENPAYGSITLSLRNNGCLVADLLDRAVPSLITLNHVSGEFFVAHDYGVPAQENWISLRLLRHRVHSGFQWNCHGNGHGCGARFKWREDVV